MKYLRLFENTDEDVLYELFLKQYSDVYLKKMIEDDFNGDDIYINDNYIEDMDSDDLDDSLIQLEEMFGDKEDYNINDQTSDETNISDIEESIFWRFTLSAKSKIKNKVNEVACQYVTEQLQKILEHDSGLISAVYKKHKNFIEEYISVPDWIIRGGKTGLLNQELK